MHGMMPPSPDTTQGIQDLCLSANHSLTTRQQLYNLPLITQCAVERLVVTFDITPVCECRLVVILGSVTWGWSTRPGFPGCQCNHSHLLVAHNLVLPLIRSTKEQASPFLLSRLRFCRSFLVSQFPLSLFPLSSLFMLITAPVCFP